MKRSEEAIARVSDYESRINVGSGAARQRQHVGVTTCRGYEADFKRTSYQFYVGGMLLEGTSMLQTAASFSGLRPVAMTVAPASARAATVAAPMPVVSIFFSAAK